jgi:hypothetical protein
MRWRLEMREGGLEGDGNKNNNKIIKIWKMGIIRMIWNREVYLLNKGNNWLILGRKGMSWLGNWMIIK